MNTLAQLPRSAAEILAEFDAYRFQHPLASASFNDILTTLGAEASPRVVIFAGPSGVGKSTVIAAACNRLMLGYEAQMIAEPDFVPMVTISAVPPNGVTFSWKDFYIRLLTGQHEPLVDKKLLLPRQTILVPGQPLGLRSMQETAADALRRSLEEYFRRRRTKFLVIDEAHHMLLVNGWQRLECQFECLKSLTIQTGVTIVLTGTYRLLDILDQSGQLTRRSKVVNFGRYDLRRADDRLSFRKILGNLEAKLSNYVPTKLSGDAEYFYKKCAGCVGILKDWLMGCLEAALRESAPEINATFAERFALTNNGLLTIVEEACLGEARLADVGDDRLMDLLNHGVLLARGEHLTTRQCRSRRPGTRKPKRDPVGDISQP